jgi:hypothetical protein
MYLVSKRHKLFNDPPENLKVFQTESAALSFINSLVSDSDYVYCMTEIRSGNDYHMHYGYRYRVYVTWHMIYFCVERVEVLDRCEIKNDCLYLTNVKKDDYEFCFEIETMYELHTDEWIESHGYCSSTISDDILRQNKLPRLIEKLYSIK